MFVLDSHVDTPTILLEGVDIGLRQSRWHVDFPRMREGGVDGVFFAVYSLADMPEKEALGYAVRQISKIYDTVDTNGDKVALARTAADAVRNKENGLLSVFIGMENGTPIGDDLKMLRFFGKMGVRYLTLCHNADNLICDSAAGHCRWGGLSEFGKDVISEMNNLDILVDVSHSADTTFYDVLKYSKRPVIASHSSCRALCGHRRNLSDEMIKDLAAQGGVIQINFYPVFLQDGFNTPELDAISEEVDHWQAKYRADLYDDEARRRYYDSLEKIRNWPSVSYRRIVDHIEHAVEIAGVDHVGLGSDFDGIEIAPDGLRDISKYRLLFAEMRERGFSEEEIEKIAGGNLLRLL